MASRQLTRHSLLDVLLPGGTAASPRACHARSGSADLSRPPFSAPQLLASTHCDQPESSAETSSCISEIWPPRSPPENPVEALLCRIALDSLRLSKDRRLRKMSVQYSIGLLSSASSGGAGRGVVCCSSRNRLQLVCTTRAHGVERGLTSLPRAPASVPVAPENWRRRPFPCVRLYP